MLNWPPISAAASNSVTAWPRSASVVAQARPAGPAPTTAIFLRVVDLHDHKFGFVACTRIEQARSVLVLEHVIEAGLVAGDAGVDAVAASGLGLVDPVGVGQQRPRHRHHVGIAVGEDFLGDLGHVDAVGRDQRNRDLALQLARHPGERAHAARW